MRIGEFAKATECSIETIRYYEHEGLLPPPARSSGNYRLYGEAHAARLRFIRNCRSLDMTHEEIRALLAFRDAPERPCEDVNALLEEHIGHVARRIRALEALKRELKALRQQCRSVRPAGDCRIMRSLDRGVRRSDTARDQHGRLDRTHR
ncbi:MAG TPA: Cd(II)/Pb(II)-responsive transcriptional regulator [Casimicrobiaceae bacterium]|nr:Cd(II)/Pb(II)-responsive transcriptional regulator [Casimicrobiaceae bacterium]